MAQSARYIFITLILLFTGCSSLNKKLVDNDIEKTLSKKNTKAVAFGTFAVHPQYPQGMTCGLLGIEEKDSQPFTRTKARGAVARIPGYDVTILSPGAYIMEIYCSSSFPIQQRMKGILSLQLNIPETGKAYYFGHIDITFHERPSPTSITGFAKSMVDGQGSVYITTKISDNYQQAVQDYQHYYSRIPFPIEKNFPVDIVAGAKLK